MNVGSNKDQDKAALEGFVHIVEKLYLLWGHVGLDEYLGSLLIADRPDRAWVSTRSHGGNHVSSEVSSRGTSPINGRYLGRCSQDLVRLSPKSPIPGGFLLQHYFLYIRL